MTPGIRAKYTVIICVLTALDSASLRFSHLPFSEHSWLELFPQSLQHFSLCTSLDPGTQNVRHYFISTISKCQCQIHTLHKNSKAKRYLHRNINQTKKRQHMKHTFVTTIIVNTSPLLKGKSCSDVPLKLYLATHSVPCGHGVYGNIGKSSISKHI